MVLANPMYTAYINVYLVISLPKLPCIHRIFMVLANPANPTNFHTYTLLRASTHERTHSYRTELHSTLHLKCVVCACVVCACVVCCVLCACVVCCVL